MILIFFFFQAEDGIRDLVLSRGLGDVYKRQLLTFDPIRSKMTKKSPFKGHAKVLKSPNSERIEIFFTFTFEKQNLIK